MFSGSSHILAHDPVTANATHVRDFVPVTLGIVALVVGVFLPATQKAIFTRVKALFAAQGGSFGDFAKTLWGFAVAEYRGFAKIGTILDVMRIFRRLGSRTDIRVDDRMVRISSAGVHSRVVFDQSSLEVVIIQHLPPL